MDAAPGEAVHVALHQYNEAVALNPLPQDALDVIELLSAEAAPIPVWLDAAKAFMAQGNVAACEAVLNDALTPDVIDGIRQLYNQEPTFELVQLNCALAVLRMEQSRCDRDNSLLNVAQEHVERAKSISKAEMLPYMVQGTLELLRNNPERAKQEFEMAARKKHNQRKNHAPLLAQAAVAFNSGNLARAHQLYAQVLRENPRCPAEVRLGIAACLYRSGKLQKASAAYNRVLQLEPGCADALLGLAMIQFGSRNAQEGLNSGLQLLQRAFAADPSHPGVLCVLCHFSLLKGMHEEAKQLAEAALLGCDTNRLRVTAFTLLGRCNHALGDFKAAQQNYAQAIRLDPKEPLAHLGTAQVYLAASGEVTNVVSELELVLQTLPGNTDAMQLLGGLLSVLPERVTKTMDAHREAITKKVDDAVLQEIAGELLASVDPASALESFERAVALHRGRQAGATQRNEARATKRQQLLELQGQPGESEAQALLEELGEDEEVVPVPAKLLNNAAVLKYRAGNSAEALALMQEATQSMMVDATPAMHKITIGYNIARLQEASGDLKAASKAYQDLVQQFPGYIDCYLRLSALARAAGDMDKAREWADAATQQAGGDVDAQALLATLYLQRGDNQSARNCITKAEAVAPEAKHDPYLRLTHANVIMAMLPTGRYSGLSPQDRAKHQDYITKALGLYREVIKAQPDNIYAVNGIGTCLAELGHLAAAKEAFNEVIRATSRTKGFVKLPEAYVNIGHLGLAKKQYPDALRMYELAGRMNNQRDVQVLTLMSRAYHDAGDHMSARRCLLKGLHQFPTDMKLRFNLAFVLQEQALKYVKRSYMRGDKQKLEDFTTALDALKQASRLFKQLTDLGPEALVKGGLDFKKVAMHGKFCADTLPKSESMLREAKDELKRVEAENQLKQAELNKAETERQLKEATRKAAEEAERKRKDAEARRVLEEAKAKVAELNQARRLTALGPEDGGDGSGGEGKAGKGKKRKKGGAAAAAAADEDFYVDDSAPIERVPKKNVKAELKRGGLDSDEEEADPDVEGLFGSDDEGGQQDGGDNADGDFEAEAEGAGGAGGAAPRPSGGGRLRRRAAAAGAGDEQMGENDAGQAPVDGLFVDDDMQDDELDEGGGQQPPQRKRQRQQTLGSDDEGDDDGPAAAADAAAGEGNGTAAAADDGMDEDELFE